MADTRVYNDDNNRLPGCDWLLNYIFEAEIHNWVQTKRFLDILEGEKSLSKINCQINDIGV